MTKSLKKLKKIVVKKYSDKDLGFFCQGDLFIEEDNYIFNLSKTEIEEFATASCFGDLWIFRALSYRLGVPVRKADWFWYNY